MRVWVLWFTHGVTTGVLDCCHDLAAGRARAGAHLREVYRLDGVFVRVASPEPYFRDDERVYRCGGTTLVARPFTIDNEAATKEDH